MFRFWIRKLFGRLQPFARPRISSKTNRARLDIEGLEVREVPAFLTPVSYSTGTNPAGIAVGDFNGDGRDDIAVVNYSASGSVGVMLSNADGYAFNPLDAGIPYVFTVSDAGSHTFTGAIRLVTGGDQTVTVSAPNMTAATVTVNVTGQVTHLAVSAPIAANAGDTFQITVSAVDSQGAVAPGYSSTVHFSSTDALAGLPTDCTFTPDAGTHTFTVTMKTTGTRHSPSSILPTPTTPPAA